MNDGPIGFFDSGVGGLTILRVARRLLPDEDMVFLADRAHFPYGAIDPGDLRRPTSDLAGFLLDRRCKLIVVACNTATVHALAHLRATFPRIPFVGVVPVVKTLTEQTRTGTIALLSTPATAESAYLRDMMAQFAAGRMVINLACPGLADLVEAGDLDGAAITALLEQHLAPIRASAADVLGLGCTHYPFLRRQIRGILGPDVRIYDSALPVARRIRSVLFERDALAPARRGRTELFSTGEASEFTRVARSLMYDECLIASEVHLGGAETARSLQGRGPAL